MGAAYRKLTADEIQQLLQQFDGYLGALVQQWTEENPEQPSWFWLSRKRLVDGTRFIIQSLDKMIVWIEDMIPTGPDKKAAVLLMAGKLFDSIVVAAMPVWLKPVATVIRKVVVDIIMSNVIDFIVSKYNEGIWNKDKEVENGSQNQEQQPEAKS